MNSSENNGHNGNGNNNGNGVNGHGEGISGAHPKGTTPSMAIVARVNARRAMVAECLMTTGGVTAIAKKLGLKRWTVHKDIAVIDEEWRREGIANVDKVMRRSLARSERMLTDLWQEWERSKQDAKRVVKEASDTAANGQGQGGGRKTKAREDVKGQYGDAGLAAELRAQLEFQCKLVGAFAPERHKVELSDEGMHFVLSKDDVLRAIEVVDTPAVDVPLLPEETEQTTNGDNNV